MSSIIVFRPHVLALCCLAASSSLMAQDLADNLDGLSFDNLSFDDAFFDASEDNTPDWLAPFNFRLSQQILAQVNSHAVALASGGALDKPAKTENNRVSLLARYQNPFAAGWLIQASAQAKLYWPGDYEYRANDGNIDTEFRLNELFVQRSVNNNSLKFGAQTVVWGENIGNSVLDVINTSEYRDLSIIDIEDARLNQWLLVWDHFSGNRQVSSFVNLYPEFNPPPVRGSPFFFEPAFNLTDYRRDKALFEIGSQVRWSIAGSDISLMGAYLYENQLHYSAPSSGVGDAQSHANDYVLLGASANRAIGKLLLNLDIAYSHDVLADVLWTPAQTTAQPELMRVPMKKLGATVGLEYAIDNDQNIMIGLSSQTLLNSGDALQAGQTLIEDSSDGNALMRYSNSLRNGDALVAVTVQSALDAASLLASVSLNYTLTDNLAIMSQIIATRSDPDSALAVLDEDLRIGLTLTWSF